MIATFFGSIMWMAVTIPAITWYVLFIYVVVLARKNIPGAIFYGLGA